MILVPLLLPGVSGCSETVSDGALCGIAEPARGAFDLFDEPIDAFGAGIGDARGDERLTGVRR